MKSLLNKDKIDKAINKMIYYFIILFMLCGLLLVVSSCAIRKHEIPPIGTDMIVKSVEPLKWDGTMMYYLIPLDPEQHSLDFRLKGKLNVQQGDTIRITILKLPNK